MIRYKIIFFILICSSTLTAQTWLKYEISTGTTTSFTYPVVSAGSSAYKNSNSGILPTNLSADTSRAFFPLDIVNDPNAYPWRIVIEFGGVTGVLIDPYHILTAGHVLEFETWFNSYEIHPAYENGNAPYGYAHPEILYRPQDYAQCTPTDIGIIKLDRPIGCLTGWYGVGYNNDNSFFSNNIFINPCYPSAGLYNGQNLYCWKGIFDYIDQNFLYSFRTGVAGMSGSPAFARINGNNVVYSYVTNSGIGYNRINSSKYDAINFVLQSDNSQSSDLIPLNLNAYPSTLKTGTAPDSLKLVLLNYSSMQFSKSLIDVNIYLSTDSIITNTDMLLTTYSYNGNLQSLSSEIIKISSLPQINKPPGTYWLGAIISGDVITTNNTTGFQDAAKIIINTNDNVRISGVINSTQSNSGISSVLINGLIIDGTTYSVKTDYKGYYECYVPIGWSGTLTPSKTGYNFNNFSTSYANISTPVVTNYQGTKITFTMSGIIKSPVNQTPVRDVKMTGLPGEPLTNAAGTYSVPVYYGWSGSVVPKRGMYSFEPFNFDYSNLISSTNELFKAGFYIRGRAYNNDGLPVTNAIMSGFPIIAQTDTSGSYSALLDSGWTGTVTPIKDNIRFNPDHRNYLNLAYSQSLQDYIQLGNVAANVKIYLSGCFVTGTDTMSTALNYRFLLPLIAPTQYSNKGITFEYRRKNGDTLNTYFFKNNPNVVDWIIIELRNPKVKTESVDTIAALLRNDGRIISTSGDTLVQFNSRISSGNYYIVIRHRNHIAVMSKQAVAINLTSTLYDFTTGLNKYLGNDAKLLSNGKYGMYAGDANFDGFVNESDFLRYNTDNLTAYYGYTSTDFNMDGYVSSRDFNLYIRNNRLGISTHLP